MKMQTFLFIMLIIFMGFGIHSLYIIPNKIGALVGCVFCILIGILYFTYVCACYIVRLTEVLNV